MRPQCAFNAPSMRLQCVFNASSMRLQCVLTPAPDCCSQSPSSPPQVQKIIFEKSRIFKKVENDPTQICPLGTHEQHIFAFLFETFPREKTGGAFFKIARERARARARARARTGPRASRAQNEGRHAPIAPFRIFRMVGTS